MTAGYEFPEFVTVYRTSEPFVLFVVKLTLNADGIHCRLAESDPLGLGIPVDLAADGQHEVEVQVRDCDVDRAMAVLLELEPEEGL